jgi:hypothetical protein
MANINLKRIVNMFDGTNFQTWKTHIVLFFKQEAHWEYVDGFNVKLATPTNQPKWDLQDVKEWLTFYYA